MRKQRESWIDSARGIAIVLVVIGHVVSSYHESGLYQDSILYNFTTQFIYSFHMPLFMMLSGYLYSKSRHKNKSYEIKKRLLSYGVPYIVFSVFWILMKLVLSSMTNSSVSIIDIPRAAFYPVSFMWFIYALLIMQIVQIFLGDMSSERKAIHLLIGGGGYCIQPILAAKLDLIQFSDCILNDVLRNYIYFLIGVYILPKVLDMIKRNCVIWLSVSAIFLLTGNVAVYILQPVNMFAVRFILALVGCILMISIAHLLPSFKVLSYMGKQTLPIYVLQGFAIAGSRLMLTKLRLNDTLGLLPLMVCTLCGILLPLMAYWISKRIWKLETVFYPTKYISIER